MYHLVHAGVGPAAQREEATMQFDDDVVIDATSDAVWAVYSDVERWPTWTDSVREVAFLDGDRVAMGARVRIRQPKLPTAKWEVTAVEPGRSWTWESHAPGVHTVATHTLEPLDDRRTHVRQTIAQRGFFAAIAARLYANLTRSYLAMEAAGLKQRCESHTHA